VVKAGKVSLGDLIEIVSHRFSHLAHLEIVIANEFAPALDLPKRKVVKECLAKWQIECLVSRVT